MTSERVIAGGKSLAVVAICTTVAALLQYELVLPALGNPPPKLVLVVAILASAAYCGLWAGLLATALCMLIAIDSSTIGAPNAFAFNSLALAAPVVLLAIAGVVASVLAEELHRARRRAERRQLALQKEIADRRVVEQKVVDSEARFRELAESLPDIMFATDGAGRNVYTNQRWFEYTGIPRSPDDNAQRPAKEAIHPDDLQQVSDAWRFALASGTPYETRHRLRAADGAYRWFIARARPVWRSGSAGEAPRWFGVATDIDSQMQAEESLREADRRKNEFLAVLAHELRNPLAPIKNALQLIHQTPNDTQAVAYARDVLERQVATMVRLIDDLLDVGRITSGKLSLRRERVALQTVIDAALETARPLITVRRQSIALDVPPAAIMLDCDPTRISQVLGNLLNNAARYTPPLGRITLSAADNGNEVEIRISDDGAGIAPEAIDSIFMMFSQAGSNPGEGDAGLGVGLPLARALTALHGGSIEARSAGLGRGTELIVRLPRDQPSPGSEVDRSAAATPAALKANGAGTRRVLVVDDNRDAAESLAALLRVSGHEVAIGHDGAQALQLAEQFRPEVMLLDVSMPKMNGHEAARRLRAEKWGKPIYIVALSGFGQEHDRAHSLQAGCDAHLTKPLSPDELEKALAAARNSLL